MDKQESLKKRPACSGGDSSEIILYESNKIKQGNITSFSTFFNIFQPSIFTSYRHCHSKLPTIPTAHQASRNEARRCYPGRSLQLPYRVYGMSQDYNKTRHIDNGIETYQKFGIETPVKIVSCKKTIMAS